LNTNLIVWIQIWPVLTVWGPKNSKIFKTSSLFYVSYFDFLYNCFVNYVFQKMNSKIVKYWMVVLIEREKVDVAVGWMLQAAARALLGEKEKESWRGVIEIEI
jgi:hypothetical protein